ncbi:MAG: GAF domain-containing protein [Deltaproteobacteria bacterium]|nr:MAG: GAF domain-containing protein [Deltaproteobacteria bacterium]
MASENKIDINIFKVVTKAIAESDDLGIMADHLTQLLVGALEIKGCTLFALNNETKELEILATFGMSIDYLNKGPVVFDKSIGCIQTEDSIVIKDVGKTDLLQYPDEAISEGIGALVSMPVLFHGDTMGALRLYHRQVWDISRSDLDSLMTLSEIIGLAMMYTQLFQAAQSFKEALAVLPGLTR